MALTKRDQILKQYADDVLAAHTKQLKAIDKARRARDTALAALDVGTPKRSKPRERSKPKRAPARG